MNKREETILILFVWKISVFCCLWIDQIEVADEFLVLLIDIEDQQRSMWGRPININISLNLQTTTFLVLNLSVAKDENQITLLTRIYTMWIDQMYAVFFRNSVCAAVTAICKSNAINIDNESRPQAAHSDSFITFVVCLIVLFTLFVHFFFYWSKKWVRKSWILWVMINHCWWQTQQCKTRNNGMSVHPETE